MKIRCADCKQTVPGKGKGVVTKRLLCSWVLRHVMRPDEQVSLAQWHEAMPDCPKVKQALEAFNALKDDV